jgi:hypothetical protein
LRNDLDICECHGVRCIPKRVVEMPVGVEEVQDWLIRPPPDLVDVLACARGQQAGIHHKRAFVTDDHDGVPLRKPIWRIGVPNLIDTISQFVYGPFLCVHRIGG